MKSTLKFLTTQTPYSDLISTQRSILDLWIQDHKNLGQIPQHVPVCVQSSGGEGGVRDYV